MSVHGTFMAHPLQSRPVRPCCRKSLTCTNDSGVLLWTPLIRLRDAEVAGSSPAVPTEQEQVGGGIAETAGPLFCCHGASRSRDRPARRSGATGCGPRWEVGRD